MCLEVMQHPRNLQKRGEKCLASSPYKLQLGKKSGISFRKYARIRNGVIKKKEILLFMKSGTHKNVLHIYCIDLECQEIYERNCFKCV